MERPRIDRQRREIAQKRRATGVITAGIEERVEELHWLSRWQRVRETGPFAGLYAAGAAFVYFFGDTWPPTILGIVLMGLALNSLGILIHEGLHGLLDRNPGVNHGLSFLCGLPLLISATAYQVTHCDHHFELGRKLDYGTYKQHLGNKRLVWIAYFAQLFLGSIIYVIFIPVLAIKSASTRSRFFIVTEYFLITFLVSMLGLFASLESISLYWIYPSFVLMVLSNIRGLASHALGDLDDIYLSSRTVQSSSLVSFLFLHENYHLAHHLFPQVPSYHLKKVHALTWNRLPRALYSTNYREFLATFFRAASTRELRPRGIVHPGEGSHPKAISTKTQYAPTPKDRTA